MAGETFIDGDDVLFSIWDTDAYEPIGCLRTSTLSESVEVNEKQTKCDPGNVVKTAGAYSYEISGEGDYIDEAVDAARQSHRKLAGYMRAKTLITWRMATGITAPTMEYGYGYITALELTGEAGEDSTFTFTISGTGAITSTDPEA